MNIRSVLSGIGASIGAASAVGLLEWYTRFGWTHDADAASLLALATLYGAFGLAAGLFVAVMPRLHMSPGAYLGVPLGALAMLGASWQMRVTPANSVLVAVTLALIAISIVAAVIRAVESLALRWPTFLKCRAWWMLCALLIILAFGQTVRDSVASFDAVVVLLISATALLCFAHGYRRPTSTGFFAAAYVVVVLGCVISTLELVPRSVPQRSEQPNVLLITIDTLRADHIGAYGYQDARTPNIDALAGQGTLFANAIAAGVITGPSHSSILSGLDLASHTVKLNLQRLPSTVEILPDFLRGHGFVTTAFPSAYPTSEASGLLSRFDHYDDDFRSRRVIPRESLRYLLPHVVERSLTYRDEYGPIEYRPAVETVDLFENWLNRNADRRFFAWVHLFDPHLPYRPPTRFLTDESSSYSGPVTGEWYALNGLERLDIIASETDVKQMRALYDAEISYVDEQVGRILELIRRSTQDDLLVILTADHGESMGEHGLYWSRDLYDPSTRVPLVIATVGRKSIDGRVVNDQVRSIDITPTVLDILEIETSHTFDGVSLAAAIEEMGKVPSLPAVSTYYPEEPDIEPEKASLRHKGWKLIERKAGFVGHFTREESTQLFSLEKDPTEVQDLNLSFPEVAQEMSDTLKLLRVGSPSRRRELSEEQLQQLRSLGYVR